MKNIIAVIALLVLTALTVVYAKSSTSQIVKDLNSIGVSAETAYVVKTVKHEDRTSSIVKFSLGGRTCKSLLVKYNDGLMVESNRHCD